MYDLIAGPKPADVTATPVPDENLQDTGVPGVVLCTPTLTDYGTYVADNIVVQPDASGNTNVVGATEITLGLYYVDELAIDLWASIDNTMDAATDPATVNCTVNPNTTRVFRVGDFVILNDEAADANHAGRRSYECAQIVGPGNIGDMVHTGGFQFQRAYPGVDPGYATFGTLICSHLASTKFYKLDSKTFAYAVKKGFFRTPGLLPRVEAKIASVCVVAVLVGVANHFGYGPFSDRDFLLIPGEEPNANFGGHYMFVFPRPLFYTHVKQPAATGAGQPFAEELARYGSVYHTTTAAQELELLEREQGLVWQTHPRTKGSAGYPDAVRDKDFFKSDRFLGGSYQSLPVDLSEKRLCEKRCLGLLDDMNNWGASKYMIAEGDTYMKYADDETYPQLAVNYVRLDRVPGYNESWAPVLNALRAGAYFVTSGEVLLHNWSVEGGGRVRIYNVEAEWTFPPDFAELVWGDGTKVDRRIIPLTNMAPFGSHQFRLPFEADGKKWVRFALWDSAGNGAFTQPVHLK